MLTSYDTMKSTVVLWDLVDGSLMGPTTVGNYAEVLKKNLTKDSVDFTKEDLNLVQARKRQHIIPTYAREEQNQTDSDIPRVSNGPEANTKIPDK